MYFIEDQNYWGGDYISKARSFSTRLLIQHRLLAPQRPGHSQAQLRKASEETGAEGLRKATQQSDREREGSNQGRIEQDGKRARNDVGPIRNSASRAGGLWGCKGDLRGADGEQRIEAKAEAAAG